MVLSARLSDLSARMRPTPNVLVMPGKEHETPGSQPGTLVSSRRRLAADECIVSPPAAGDAWEARIEAGAESARECAKPVESLPGAALASPAADRQRPPPRLLGRVGSGGLWGDGAPPTPAPAADRPAEVSLLPPPVTPAPPRPAGEIAMSKWIDEAALDGIDGVHGTITPKPWSLSSGVRRVALSEDERAMRTRPRAS